MKSEIILLYEPEQLDVVISYFGREKLREGKLSIIALEYEVEILLKERGIPYNSIQKYLKIDNLKHIHKKASLFLGRLYRAPEMIFFQHSGIPLLENKGQHLLHYLKEILYYMEIINCIFDNYPNIKKLWVPQSKHNSFISPTSGPVAPFAYRIPIDITKLLGEKRSVSVSILPCNKRQLIRRRLRFAFRKGITFLLEQVLLIINFIITLARPPQKIKIFVIDHWRNIRFFIEKMDNIELVMMVRKEILKMGLRQVWEKRARFHHPKDFLTPEIRKTVRNKQEQFRSTWSALGDKPKFSEIFYYQNISFWPLIKHVLDDLILKDSRGVICEIESIKELLLHFSINRVLLRASAKDEFYLTAKVASQLKIPSIELQHGLVTPNRTFVYFSPVRVDYFVAYGKLTKKILIADDNDPRQIIEVGSPRFDSYLTKSYNQQSLEELRVKLKIDTSRPVILVIPPAVRNPIKSRDCNTYEAVEILRALAALGTAISGIQIILKLRPSNMNVRFYRKAAREIFKDNVIIAQYEDMKSLIYLSDVIVSCKSTVILEAMIIGKPVVLYMIRGGPSQFQLFKEGGAIRIAHTLKDLLPEVRSLIFKDELRKNLVRKAKEFLEKNYLFDGKSYLRVIKLLRERKLNNKEY